MSAIETATLPMMLTELRLPTIKRLWPALAEQSNREGWPAERFLAALCEHEMHERETRRIDRHRAESALPPDKRLSACHRPAHWSQLMIGTMEPPRDRHIEASP